MATGSATSAALLVFAPMIDSELSRLILAHHGVPYREDRHIFGLASVYALRRAFTPQIPIFYDGALTLVGPRAIAEHFDATCRPDRILIPAAQPMRTRVEADWQRFNGRLASETAAWAYFQLLPHRALMTEPFCRGIPRWEADAVAKWAYDWVSRSFTLLLRLGPDRAGDALIRTRADVAYVDALLADGRAFITGDTLTLSDLALASALAPLLLPAGYGAPMPELADMPAPYAALVRDLQGRPTADLVRRVYARMLRTQENPSTAAPAQPSGDRGHASAA